jgi:hypothetical protein
MDTLIIGNESCDADSVFSACILAKYLNLVNSTLKGIAVISNTNDIFLKKLEIQEIFKLFKNGSRIMFIEDVNFDNYENIILVDHNELSIKEINVPVEKITLIIDHHKDSKTINCRRLIDTREKSCISLVLKYLLDNNINISKEDKKIVSIIVSLDKHEDSEYQRLKYKSEQSFDLDFKLIQNIPYSTLLMENYDSNWIDKTIEYMNVNKYNQYVLIINTLENGNYLITFGVNIIKLLNLVEKTNIYNKYKLKNEGRKYISSLILNLL